VRCYSRAMRLYIHRIVPDVEQHKPTTFAFIKAIEVAWFWKTREAAERALRIWQGILVQLPLGPAVACTDFRIEPRPQGGFVISCEHPPNFASHVKAQATRGPRAYRLNLRTQ
jgi:hypothetical protein